MHPQLHQGIETKWYLGRFKLAGLLIGLLVLGACATEQTYTSAPTEDRSVTAAASPIVQSGDQATPLTEREILIERAEYFESLADGESLVNSADAILSAAEHYIQANDFYQAEIKLNELQRQALNPIQQDRALVVRAYVAYSRGEFQNALAQLSPLLSALQMVRNPDLEPLNVNPPASQQEIDALLLSSFCYQQVTNYEAAIAALVARENVLQGAAKAETTRYTWQVINSLDSQRKQEIIESTANPLVRNRLEQSLAGQIAVLNDKPAQFSQWRESSTRLKRHADTDSIDPMWGANSPRKVAILLPLSSKFQTAAQALLDGFKYQNEQNIGNYRPSIDVYDIGDNPYQVDRYYAAALQAGAEVVIGPLGTEFANQLGQRQLNQSSAGGTGLDRSASESYQYRANANSSVPTILLGGDMRLAENTFRLSLSPENEGRQIAQQAFRDGHLNAVILAPQNTIAQRTVAAFSEQWLQLGGKVSDVISYSPAQYDHSVELKQMFRVNQSEYRHTKLSNTLGLKPEFAPYRRADIDLIVMVANNDDGRIVRPQINFFGGSSIPVYSSSTIYNGIHDPVNNMDLEHTRFPIMPWVLRSDAVAYYAGTLNQLFALGSDAYTLAGHLYALRNNTRLTVNGNTGRLNVRQNGEVNREPVWAQFQNGEAKATSAMGIDINSLDGLDQDDLQPSDQHGVYNDSNWDSRNARRKTGT